MRLRDSVQERKSKVLPLFKGEQVKVGCCLCFALKMSLIKTRGILAY